MTEPDHPGVLAPPPLLYVVGLAIAVALHWFWPMPVADHAVTSWVGGIVLVAGLALNVWGARSMGRARTPINPYKPVETIVDAGAFCISRNPLYVGLSLIFLGISLLMNSLWGIVALAPLLVAMHYGVILREERYLEARFGEPYRRYRRKVRRYL